MNSLLSLASCNRRRRFLLCGGIYVALWIATWYSARLLESVGIVSLWFLPAGLRFFCLLVFGGPGVLLEVMVQLVFALMQITGVAGTPITDWFSTNTLWRLFNLFGSLAANAALILPLRRRIAAAGDFTRPAHSVWFLATALAASALSALTGTYGIIQLGFIAPAQFAETFPSWLIGDLIGILTLTPLLLVRLWPGLHHYLDSGHWPGRRPAGAPTRQADRRTILIAAGALLVVFAIPWSLDLSRHFPLIALLLLVPLATVALHYGLRGTVLAVVLLDGGLVLLIALLDQRGEALPYQVVMIAIALVGLWLGAAAETRQRLTTRYQDFASVANDLLWEVDHRGQLIEASGGLAQGIALSPGHHWRSLLDQAWQPNLAVLNEAVNRHQPFRQIEIALPGDADGPLWLQLNGLPLLDESGMLIGYRGTAVDVTRSRHAEVLLRDYNRTLLEQVAERTRELRQSHHELEIKERHLDVLLAAVPVGVLEIDAQQCCRYINVNGCTLTGYSREQALGRSFLDFVHPDERDYVEFVRKINRQSVAIHWLEFRLDRTNLRCAAHWIALGSPDQSAEGTIMVLTNATARSQQDERLWTLAHHDGLTDLPNRNLFWDRARQALLHARRHGCGAAVLWIDLDGFKAVNDRLGHAAGDILLQQVALRLKKRMRNSDTVARMGGDEFAVIMPDIDDPSAALQTASALLASLSEPFKLALGLAHISGSIGIALFPQHAETAELLTQCADMAMYRAKDLGRNQAQLYHQGCANDG